MKEPPASPADALAPSHPDPTEQAPFPVVGIGASAGGLEAFSQLLATLRPDTGMAFVLVQHLDPDHESLLAELLGQGDAACRSCEATHGMARASPTTST